MKADEERLVNENEGEIGESFQTHLQGPQKELSSEVHIERHLYSKPDTHILPIHRAQQ